ncbi:MAG: prepilin-type N-terminal cleavage/methylation domain-containing protein [Rhodanobacteraceae bacterium]
MTVSKRAHGFTLLEILLALVLMALLMVGVWGALRTATRLTSGADALIARSDRVRAVQGFLRDYLGGAQPQGFLHKANEQARMFEGDPDTLRYVAPMPAQLGDGGLFVQTLQLVRGEDGGQVLQLTYAPLTTDAALPADAKPEVLLDQLAGGRFEYLYAAGNGKPAQWRGNWHGPGGMPLAVRVILQPAWRERIGFPEMLIPLRAGNGYSAPVALGGGR